MPAEVKARAYVAPPDFVPLFQKPWSDVVVWAVASWKVQVTRLAEADRDRGRA